MKVCPYCGEKIREFDITCLNCGKSLVTSNTTTDVTSAPEGEFGLDLFESLSVKSDESNTTSTTFENDGKLSDIGKSSSKISVGDASASDLFGSSSNASGNDSSVYQNNSDSEYQSRTSGTSRIQIGDASASDLFGSSSSGSSSSSPYRDNNSSTRSTGSSRITIGGSSASDLFGNSSSAEVAGDNQGAPAGVAGGYNPYAASQSAPAGAAGGYNPYAASQSAPAGAAGGYNPYAASQSAPAGVAGGYNPYAASQSAPTGAAGGYNPYADSAGGAQDLENDFDPAKEDSISNLGSSGGGYNPYSSSSFSSSSSNTALPESNKYGTYSKKTDSSINAKSVRQQKAKNKLVSIIKGIIIAVIVAAIGIYAVPIVKDLAHKQYKSIVKKSVRQYMEQDSELLTSISAFEYEDMLKSAEGGAHEKQNTDRIKARDKAKRALANIYGDDVDIEKIEIQSVDGLTGDEKQQAIQKAIESVQKSIGPTYTKNVDASEYINTEEISQAKTLKVKVTMKGYLTSDTKTYRIDIVKFDSTKDWKLLGIYDEN